MNDAVSKFWARYHSALSREGVCGSQCEWYQKMAQWYINAHFDLKLVKHVGEDVAKYFSKLITVRSLKEWQYVRNVEAIRILFQEVVDSEWAIDFPWEKWKEPHLGTIRVRP